MREHGCRLIIFIVLVLSFTMMISCQSTRQPPSEESGYSALNRQLAEEQGKLRNARKSQEKELEHSSALQKPDIARDISPLIPEFNPLQESIVSISINNRPLHDVLFVVARDAGLNLVVSPEVSLENRVTISFDQTPASVVVDRLLEAYDLAWQVNDNVLYVSPFQEEVFQLDFLNANTNVSMRSGGDIFGSSDPESGSHDLSGSFAMDSSFGQGVGAETTYGFLKTNLEEILSEGDDGQQGDFVLDPTAGSLHVKATPKKMRTVRKFVNNLQEKLSRQVVIDAQILEVMLNDSFQLGVDWSYVTERIIRGYGYDVSIGWQAEQGFGSFELGQDDPQPLVISSNTDQINKTSQFSAAIDALEVFGSVHVVSNPHVRTRHMQPALVTSGRTTNYIKEITRERDSNDVWTFTTDTASAFEGVMLGVMPFITESGIVDLNIFPISSQVDLSRTENVGDGRITLPTVDVRNVNTNVRVRDGDTVILGGLIQKSQRDSDRATPGLSRAPLVGWMFKQRHDESELSELVVIMHVRILSQ